jgi:Cdc6-like AAA superfamily ATPase
MMMLIERAITVMVENPPGTGVTAAMDFVLSQKHNDNVVMSNDEMGPTVINCNSLKAPHQSQSSAEYW